MFRPSLRRRPKLAGPASRRKATASGYRGVTLLAASVALAACTVVLDFGDEKQLVSDSGTAGVGGSSSAGAGGTGGQAGSAGSTPDAAGGTAGVAGGGGAAGSSGAGGVPADAGYCATDAAPAGPDSGDQLFFYFDAKDQPGGTNDGDCTKDDARLVPLDGTMPADCDFVYGVGKEWIQLYREESIACVGCLKPTPDLWVEFLMQYKFPVSGGGTIVFQPLRGAPLASNATLPTVVIDDQHHPGLKCGNTERYSQFKLMESLILMWTYEYDFKARVGRLYLRNTSEGYAIGQLTEPDVEVTCECDEPADGFFLRGIPGTGELLFDEFRAAENHGAINDSY